MDLQVLLQAAILVEAFPAQLAAVRPLASVDPLVPLQVPGALEALAAVRTDEALLEEQPLHRPPAHGAVQAAVLTRGQQPTAEQPLLLAAAGRSQSGDQRRLREAVQGAASSRGGLGGLSVLGAVPLV